VDNSLRARPSAPATSQFIGGFGQPDPHDPEDLRITRVCVRRKDPDKLLQNMKAEDIGFEYGIYDVEKPTADLPADYAETEWKRYEPRLPRAIRALDSGAFGPAEWQIILLHLRATWARHPDFGRDVADQKAAQGAAGLTSDDVQRLRTAAPGPVARRACERESGRRRRPAGSDGR
jgi:hypothetical protein